MRAELGLPSVRGDDDKGGGMMGGFGGSMGGVGGGKAKRPIQVKFEIPYFTTSGIQVRYLKIIEPKVRKYIVLYRIRLEHLARWNASGPQLFFLALSNINLGVPGKPGTANRGSFRRLRKPQLYFGFMR
jgi:hypothetical protein